MESIPMKLSFIVPCYNEEASVEPFYREFSQVFDEAPERFEWELVFVNDGSSDKTSERLLSIASQNPQHAIKVVQFTRNFGKEAAIWAGLKNSDGDVMGIIDADLQQPPADALNMVRMLEEDPSCDCVAAYQESRSGAGSHVKSFFYSVMSRMCGLDMIRDASDFRVFRRIVAQTMLSMPEVQRFSKGMFAWMGFKTSTYPYTPRDRSSGKSKWSTIDLFKYAFEGIFAYSTTPLNIATAIGVLISVFAIGYFVYLVLKTMIIGADLPGFPTITACILLLGGVQLIVLGIIGKYLGNAYLQGKQRPICIVREVVSNQDVESMREA